jgi:hypothetical protein
MKNRLKSFAYLLPLIELLFAAMIMVLPALRFFFHLKQMAHGSGSVSLASGEFVFTIPADRYLFFALDWAGRWAAKPITILNTPAKLMETLVSLAVARKGYWWPPSLLRSTWHALIYPIYALPAWIYLGLAIDALIGRRRPYRWSAILSVCLALTCASLFYGFRFGMPAAEREGQERLGWFIDGLALWAVLFSIPVVAWMRQKNRGIPLENEPPPS